MEEVTQMYLRLKLAILIFLLLFVVPDISHATIYFYYDAEDCTDGEYLPFSIFEPIYGRDELRGRCVSNTTAPQGNKIIQWNVTDPVPPYSDIHHQLNDVFFDTIPPSSPGATYYFAFFFRFDRIDGQDIWHEGVGTECFDKAAEIRGGGIRWIINFGERAMGNQDHHYTIFIATDKDYNPELESPSDTYSQNYNGYSRFNPIQLEYEKWNTVVFKMKWATDKTGEIGMWVNGIKVMEYMNFITVLSPGTFSKMMMHGTIAQPLYDAPPHYRKFDAIIFTDNWQDIINGGYLNTHPSPPYLNP